MGQHTLKPGWTRVKFGDVVRQVKDKVDARSSGLEWYIAGEHMDTDDLRIRRRGEITDDYLGPAFHMRFQPGQVLYGSRRTYLRKVAVADFAGICANTTFVLEPKDPDTLLPELLPFIMQTKAFHDFSITNSKGSVNPYINFSDLAEYEFALPPLAEQHRLVHTLQAADRVYELRRDLADCAATTFQAASAEQFSQVLKRNAPILRLAKVSSLGPQSGLYKKKDFYGKGYPMVHMGELFGTNCITSNTEMQLVDLGPQEIAKYSLTPNDLLFGRRSVVLEGAGRCVLVKRIKGTVAFESSILRVTLDSRLVESAFLYEWFNSPEGSRQIRSIVTFTTVAGVKGSDVAKLRVPVPDSTTQQVIAEHLGALRGGIDHTTQAAQDAKQLFASIRETVLQEVA